MGKCLVVLSGGLDSTTVLYQMINIFGVENVQALTFDYGQRHLKEVWTAEETCKTLGVKWHVVPVMNIFKNSALTGDKEVPEGHYEDENMKQTVVPFRNTVFLSIAMAVAASNGLNYVAIGVHAGDHAIYPDCRFEFIEVMRKVGLLGDYNKIEILTPFQFETKATIVARGLELGVDYSKTWTCYNGRKMPCGKCGSCVERLEAFKENNAKDPLEYEVIKDDSNKAI